MNTWTRGASQHVRRHNEKSAKEPTPGQKERNITYVTYSYNKDWPIGNLRAPHTKKYKESLRCETTSEDPGYLNRHDSAIVPEVVFKDGLQHTTHLYLIFGGPTLLCSGRTFP